MLKRSGLSSQDLFLSRDDASVCAAASVQDFKRHQRCKDDTLYALFARFLHSRLVYVWESEVGDGSHLVIPGDHQDQLGWGCPNHRQRLVRHHSVVDGLLQKIHLNWQGLGLKSPEIMEFFKWFIWKLFRLAHLFLITLRTSIFSSREFTCSRRSWSSARLWVQFFLLFRVLSANTGTPVPSSLLVDLHLQLAGVSLS